MNCYTWPRPPIDIVVAFEARRPDRGEVGALILWATWTVEGLHYLDEIDAAYQSDTTAHGSAQIVNICHVRWATGSAITALDLCAAALAREFCGLKGQKEFDLRNFGPSSTQKKTPERRAALPEAGLVWVDSVLADQRYKEVHGARNPLTHSRLRRSLGGSGPRDMQFMIAATGSLLTTREIVSHARDLATDSVTSFLQVVDSLP